MQIEIRFENQPDDDTSWTALKISRLLCDIQRFATVVQNLPIGGSQYVSHFEGLDSGYAEIVTADVSPRGALYRPKADAVISMIKKTGPFIVVFELPAIASVSSPMVKQLCRLVMELQGTIGPTRHRSSHDLIAKRLKGLGEYAALRESLEQEESRERLEGVLVRGLEALVDGRYPKIRKMGRVKSEDGETHGGKAESGKIRGGKAPPAPRRLRGAGTATRAGKPVRGAANAPVRPPDR